MADSPTIVDAPPVSPWGEAAPAPLPAAPQQAPATPANTFLWGLISTLILAGWIGLWAGWLGALALVGGVFVHEFGHLMVINWAGCGPSRIRIIPFFGGAATMTRAPDSTFKGVLIALAGPAFGLVAALPFFVAAVATGQRGWLAGAFYVGALNLINLAPAAPLDGANALGPALARIHPWVERGVLAVIALVALAWALQRGSWLFAAVIAFGTLRAVTMSTRRAPSRPLTAIEWAASIALYAFVVGACLAVALLVAAQGAGVSLRPFTLHGFGGARMSRDRAEFDGVLIVGAGLAGLSAALAAAPRPVLVLAAAPLGEGCSSAWAQGGMAAALSNGDAPELHAADTIAAGAGLCDPGAVAILTREGPAAVRRLAALGAPFDRREDGGFVQSLEAAHGLARVARVGGDGAGRAIMDAVIRTVRATSAIEVREGWRVRRLLTDRAGRVRGVLAQDPAGALTEIVAAATVLATGGLGGLYAVTTTPRGVRGEGLALAALAGAAIADAEFVQFHPTAMDLGGDPAPVATEALRGEGARLVNADGARFMARYHPAAELAPRDVVARAIAAERRAGRGAFLDARDAVGEAFPQEFPAVFAAAMAAGLDPRREPIPVVPAVHYHMGGIETDALGRTSLPGLYAAGECAATGAHGANRLASNSLLEAAVFGARAGRAAAAAGDPATAPLPAEPAPDLPDIALQSLRRAMSQGAGVVRDGAGLTRLRAEIAALEATYGPALPLVAARLVAEGALARRESRGAHFRSDYPELGAPIRSRATLRPAPAFAAA